jgi:hypothetical protein
VPAAAPLLDMYQFGVPSTMSRLLPLLEHHGLQHSHNTYWGFDSFVGLPEEADGALRPSDYVWGPGQFSLMQGDGANKGDDGGHRHLQNLRTPTRASGGLSIAQRVEQLRLRHNRRYRPVQRVRLVSGFFNTSLTDRLAHQAFAARYVDIDVDLARSSYEALSWLCRHGLVVAGTIVGYDDWYEAPFLRGGESLAHYQISNRFKVEFELLAAPVVAAGRIGHVGPSVRRPLRPKGSVCRQGVLFRVASVGVRADTGISWALITRSCYTVPLNADRLRVQPDECLHHAKDVLGIANSSVHPSVSLSLS